MYDSTSREVVRHHSACRHQAHKPFFGGFSLSESIHLSFGSSYNCSMDAEMSSTCGSTLHASTHVRVSGEQGNAVAQCTCALVAPNISHQGGCSGSFTRWSLRERERERERETGVRVRLCFGRQALACELLHCERHSCRDGKIPCCHEDGCAGDDFRGVPHAEIESQTA